MGDGDGIVVINPEDAPEIAKEAKEVFLKEQQMLEDLLAMDRSWIRRRNFSPRRKDRVFVDAINSPVSISGLQVKKGDILLGDDSGALVISWEQAEKVLEIAREIAGKEGQIEKALDAGVSLKEARKQSGYHFLQAGGK